ncbi:MAG: Fur family transcriptional regulator [Candidatus Sifarchaeia archaeon]
MPKKENELNNYHFSDNKLVEMLKQKGIRPTETRRIILSEVSKLDHPDANEIYLKIRGNHSNISMGSVYRNLNLFREKGLIYELEQVGGVPGRFELGLPDHSHFICEKCGKILDIEDQISKKTEQDLSKKLEVIIIHHRAEFYGLCKDCNPDSGK